MKLYLQIAFRNLLGNGLRSFLNISALSFCLIIIIWGRGTYQGLLSRQLESFIQSEAGDGQLRAPGFIPMDSFSYEKGRKFCPLNLQAEIDNSKSAGILFHSATVFIKGRSFPTILKGISINQSIINLPVKGLKDATDGIYPILVGTRMLKILGIGKGSVLTIRFRDSKGVFDARDFRVSEVMNVENPRVDENSIWLSLNHLQKLTRLEHQVSFIVMNKTLHLEEFKGWVFHSTDSLTEWLKELVRTDEKNLDLVYGLLLFLCALGIFNSQVVNIFKRVREIGTLIALGMTRGGVVLLFTLEGVLSAFFSCLFVPFLGAPLFYWSSKIGISTSHAEGFGLPLPERILASYTPDIFLKLYLFILIVMAFVSYIPVRRISSLNPSEALMGKISL